MGLALLTAFSPRLAGAHEQRDVGGGQYSLTVGFIDEPAFVGLENGLYLRVVELTGDRQPVEDLAGSLSAEVTLGESTMPLALLPVSGDPGVYHGSFIPTAPGDYTFHVTGQIADQAVDESFRSSPDTFDSVQPASAAQFPQPVPAGAELADQLEAAEDDAASARKLALSGLAVGAAGLVVALAALLTPLRRRRS